MPLVVEGVAESSVNTAGTSHLVTLPASIAASDLVLIIMDIGSTSATLNALTDWTETLDEASANGLKILRYTGTGVPGDPTFTSSASTRSASIAYRISGADKTIAPQFGTTATGTSATPDPPSVTPTGGISKEYLFIAFAGMAGEEADDDTWGNTPPTNYTSSPPRQKSCGTAGTNLGGLIVAAERLLTTGSAENPGTFGVDTSAAWRAQTIIVHPELAGVDASVVFRNRTRKYVRRSWVQEWAVLVEVGGPEALVGVGSTASAGSGLLSVERPLTGTGNTASSGNAFLSVALPLTGKGDTASSGSGVLTVAIGLAGTGNTATHGTGQIIVDITLAGKGDTASSGTGAANLAITLGGTGPAAASGNGILNLAITLVGKGDSASGASAELTIQGQQALAGTGTVASAGSGNLTVDFTLAGTGATAAHGSAALLRDAGLTGQGDTASSGNGALTRDAGLAGVGTASAAGSANLIIDFALAGHGDVASEGDAELIVAAAYFWQPDPVGFTRTPVAHTKDPVQFVKVGPEDSPPWP